METIIEILIDNSNSMGPFESQIETYLLPDGSTRMELAKKILLDEIIPKLDYAKKVAVRIFHSVTKSENVQEPLITTIYDDTLDKVAITSKIRDIAIPKNTGGTPITAAVKLAINELAKYPSADRKIILLTDGQETDGGDYKKTAEDALKQLGITCNIFIVGIAQSQEAEIKSKSLAEATGGTYINLKHYESASLQSALRPIYVNAVNASLKSVISVLELGNNNEISNESDKLAKDTSHAINLISNQLQSISEAINELQKRGLDNDNEESIVISENSELNERIRLASESFLYKRLYEKYADRVKWLNQDKESGSSYDFEVLDTFDNTPEFYIECKASMYPQNVFYLTKNEWLFFLRNTSNYQLFFISSALTIPKLIKVGNLLEALLKGIVIPFSSKNMKIKADRVLFTITEKQ